MPFLGATAVSVFTVAKDIFDDPANTGSDLKAALISFADSLVTKVLTSSDVAAKLAVYFGAEEVEEAIPYVGWALKALAMEAAAAQLAQTIGEVVASPRVVEFDLTVTMDAVITLTPDSSTGSEFPATATSVHLTAQYSDNTTRTYQADVDPAKVRSLTIDWHDIPVGGHVTFVVAMFSAEGWGVGKGQSATILNEITKGQQALTVAITVQQLLYPIDADTTFRHHQLLGYDDRLRVAGDSGRTDRHRREPGQRTERAPPRSSGRDHAQRRPRDPRLQLGGVRARHSSGRQRPGRHRAVHDAEHRLPAGRR